MTDKPNISRFVEKLEKRQSLTDGARAALLGVRCQIRTFAANQDIVQEGDLPKRSCLVADGIVSRHRTLRSGHRQILSFHVAGDMVDLQSALIVVADHGIRTHVATTVLTIDHVDLLRMAAEHPDLARAFWFDTLVDAAIFREWTVNVGRRSALARTAHLILEFATKMRIAGLSTNDTFDFPITQSDFADALGITSVHLNRVLQKLRGDRLIRTHMRTMSIENEPALRELAGFDARYLHLEGPRGIR